MTTMIATLSSKISHIHETIETCKFAQNVMTVKNNATKNISLDPNMLIEKLRAEIMRLRKELAVARGEEDEEDITPEEAEDLKKAITDFMKGIGELPSASKRRSAEMPWKQNHCPSSGAVT